MVVVDVLVTDHEGRPVKDLHQVDFKLLENGKPQQIAAFSYNARELARKPEPPQRLPPDVYSNKPEYNPQSGPLGIILLDASNIDTGGFGDIVQMRRAMLLYVSRHLQSGQRIAVFGLNQRGLVLLQGATTDPKLLQAALEMYYSPTRPMANTQSAASALEGVAPASPAGFSQQLQSTVDSIQSFDAAFSEIQTRRSSEVAAGGLCTIARWAQMYRGRKSLAWIGWSFPMFALGSTASSRYSGIEEKYREAFACLTDSQIAVYPVDARGLPYYSPFGDMTQARNDPRDVRDGTAVSGGARKYFNRDDDIKQSQDTMRLLGEITGGRAFINRNDLENAVAAAMEEANSYYTLAYYPADKKWDGRLRRIKVQVDRANVRVRHRDGYLADDPAKWHAHGGEDEFDVALRTLRLHTGNVFFYARVQPAGTAAKGISIEFFVERSSVDFAAAAGRQNANPDFHFMAFAPDGKLAAWRAQTADLRLKPEVYDQLKFTGILFTLPPVQLPPGNYRLRLGVRDNHNGNFGTLEIPLTSPAPAAATPAPPVPARSW